MNDAARQPRLPSLDVLRGVAVLMVLMVHAPLRAGLGALDRLHGLGSYGVDLFFVLSGFLISGLLFAELKRTDRLDLPRFWLRRGLKIWPSYYAAYGAVTLVSAFLAFRHGYVDVARQTLGGALPNLVFIQNYVRPDLRWFASWSLAIEEHFYLVFPLLLLLARRRILLVCAATSILVLLARVWGASHGLSDQLYIQSHFRADSLTFGVVLGYAQAFHPRGFARAAPYGLATVPLFAAALVLPYRVAWGRGVTETIGLTAMYLCFGGMVAIAAAFDRERRRPPALVRPFLEILRWVGTYSYTIYLAQAGALVLSGHHALARVHGLAFVAISLAGGVALSHLVERPFLRLRERWIPRRAPPEVTAAPALQARAARAS